MVDLAAAEAFPVAAAWESSLGNHRIAAERRGTERWERRGRAGALKFWTFLELLLDWDGVHCGGSESESKQARRGYVVGLFQVWAMDL